MSVEVNIYKLMLMLVNVCITDCRENQGSNLLQL